MPNNNDFFSPPSSGKSRPRPAPSVSKPASSQTSSSGCDGCLKIAGWLFLILCFGIFCGVKYLEQQSAEKEKKVKAYFASDNYKRLLAKEKPKEEARRKAQELIDGKYTPLFVILMIRDFHKAYPAPADVPPKTSWSNEDFDMVFSSNPQTPTIQKQILVHQFAKAFGFPTSPEFTHRYNAWKVLQHSKHSSTKR
jgi:hypothetical protein